MRKVDEDTIVVGTDASECSEAAVEWASEEARRSGRRLVLASVWQLSSSVIASPLTVTGPTDPYASARSLLAAAAKKVRRSGVDVETRLLEGSPAGALTEVADGAAMLVVGRHGRDVVRRSVMGSVSRACVQHARCPVVVVQPDRIAS